MKKVFLASVAGTLSLFSATAVNAAHNNPWADEDDTVLSRNHDTNQTKSADTPGEDEMLGVMNREAFGKIGGGPDGGATGIGGASASGGHNGQAAGRGGGQGQGAGHGPGGSDNR